MTMSKYVDGVLGVGGSTEGMVVIGQCDVSVQGLTTGAVKLMYKPGRTTALPTPVYVDFPDGSFTSDTYVTIFMSDDQTHFKLVGVGNNAGVYVKISRSLND